MSELFIPKTDLDYMIRIRREIHEHPEIGLDLPHTAMVVERELNALGIASTNQYLEHSRVAYLGPENAKKVIGIRTDMDALPLQEETGLPFASKIPGKMHACGHDCHTAVLLGIAKALKSVESSLKCRVKLIFQPAEETAPSGGRLMVEAGLMDDVTEVFTMHVSAGKPSGTIMLNKACMNASCHTFKITVHGKSAHAAAPQNGIDAIAVGNRIYYDIQQMRAREIGAFEPVVVGIGVFKAGQVHNIIADTCELTGTVRAHSQKIENLTYKRINEIAENACKEVGATCEVKWNEYMPPAWNDPVLSQKIIDIASDMLGPDKIIEKPLGMGSEDFAYYVEKRPGARFLWGVHAEGAPMAPGHNGKFLVDESTFCIPADIYVRYVLENGE